MSFILAGCDESKTSVAVVDHESIFVRLMTQATTLSKDEATSLFVPELDPTTFPISVDSIWKKPRLKRLRIIDGRIIGNIVVTDTSDFVLIAWAEKRGQSWFMAGWEPKLRRVKPVFPESASGTDIPPNFAAPVLRSSPVPRMVTVGTGQKTKASSKLDKQTRTPSIRVSSYGHTSSCRIRRVQRWIRKKVSFEKCLRAHRLPPGTAGRLLLSVNHTAGIGHAKLLESTLGHDELANCVAEAIKSRQYRGRSTCQFKIRLLLLPKG